MEVVPERKPKAMRRLAIFDEPIVDDGTNYHEGELAATNGEEVYGAKAIEPELETAPVVQPDAPKETLPTAEDQLASRKAESPTSSEAVETEEPATIARDLVARALATAISGATAPQEEAAEQAAAEEVEKAAPLQVASASKPVASEPDVPQAQEETAAGQPVEPEVQPSIAVGNEQHSPTPLASSTADAVALSALVAELSAAEEQSAVSQMEQLQALSVASRQAAEQRREFEGRCAELEESVSAMSAELEQATRQRVEAERQRDEAQQLQEEAEEQREEAYQQRDEVAQWVASAGMPQPEDVKSLRVGMGLEADFPCSADFHEVSEGVGGGGEYEELVAPTEDADVFVAASQAAGRAPQADFEAVEEAAAEAMEADEAEVAAALMEAAVRAEAASRSCSPDDEGNEQRLLEAQAQLRDAHEQLQAMGAMQGAADEMAEMQREMIGELEAQLEERANALQAREQALEAAEARAEALAAQLEATHAASHTTASDGAPGGSSAAEMMSSSRGLSGWAAEAERGRRAGGPTPSAAAQALADPLHRPPVELPAMEEESAAAAAATSASLSLDVKRAVTLGSASRLERSLAIAASQPIATSAADARAAAATKVLPIRASNAPRSEAPDWAMAGRAPPPGAVLRMAKGQSAGANKLSSLGGPRAAALASTNPPLGVKRAALPAHLPPVSETSLHSGDPTAAMHAMPPATSSMDAARAPPPLTYGKDGKIRPLKARGAASARPAPLQRTSLAASQARGAASAPLMLGVGSSRARESTWRPMDEQPAPPVRPPHGASPGELRLWKMQHGIPV